MEFKFEILSGRHRCSPLLVVSGTFANPSKYSVRSLRVEIEFPNLNIRTDEVPLCFDVVGGQAHVFPQVLQEEENFSIAIRCHAE